MAADLVRLRLHPVRAITSAPEKDTLRTNECWQSATEADQGWRSHHPKYPSSPGADE